jgi:hypothetical protein
MWFRSLVGGASICDRALQDEDPAAPRVLRPNVAVDLFAVLHDGFTNAVDHRAAQARQVRAVTQANDLDRRATETRRVAQPIESSQIDEYGGWS